MSASIINNGNDTGRGRAWWYDTELVALDPDYVALVAEIDVIGARVRWCPPRLCEPPRRHVNTTGPDQRSPRPPAASVAATQRSPPRPRTRPRQSPDASLVPDQQVSTGGDGYRPIPEELFQ
ncbi:hypothetical protein ACFU44_17310 [Nocardia rhizosphaerihabitans]|uniref:hypothetical protein n=1 Tax=Nocardia rhizosphaerihabitans TaxID=1691570 RepID=UPI00366AAA6E